MGRHGEDAPLYWGTLPSGLQNAISHVFKHAHMSASNHGLSPNFAVLTDLLSHYQNLKGLVLSSTIVGVGGEVGHTAELGTHEAVVGEGGDVDSTRWSSFEFLTVDYVDFGSPGH
jgi:hypothetical protein